MIAILQDFDNHKFYFENILDFNVSSNIQSPATQLAITFISNSICCPKFTNIKLKYKGYNIFNGKIDEQVISKTPKGIIVKIFARSAAYLLLDNQAQPQMYNHISLNDILLKHIYPYGFTFNCNTHSILSAYLPNFTVFTGISEWSVFKTFTTQALNLFPFILNNNNIYLSNSFPSSKLIISNNSTSANNISSTLFNYFSIAVNTKNFGIISDVFIKQPDNSFAHITNSLALNKNIKSKRFSNISASKIKNTLTLQNKKYFSVSVSLPNIIPTSAGHTIAVIDDIMPVIYSNKQFIINELVYTFTNSKLTSNLKLIPVTPLI